MIHTAFKERRILFEAEKDGGGKVYAALWFDGEIFHAQESSSLEEFDTHV